MVLINICLFVSLAMIIVTDYKKHLIYNQCICILLLISALKIYLQSGITFLALRIFLLLLLFLLCVAIGYVYITRKNEDIAGGGDYKLIASLGFLFGLKGLFICLLLELIYEVIYRYILFPEKKKAALPLGTSLGLFGVIVLLTAHL